MVEAIGDGQQDRTTCRVINKPSEKNPTRDQAAVDKNIAELQFKRSETSMLSNDVAVLYIFESKSLRVRGLDEACTCRLKET